MVFPSLRYRSRVARSQTLKCYGRVCTVVREGSRSFTCRFDGIIMTPKLENLELPKMGSVLCEAVACGARQEVSELSKLISVFYKRSSKQIFNKKVI